MIRDIFGELLGEVEFEEFLDAVTKEMKDFKNEKDNVKDSSYYYKVEDKYNNGKRISHKEKEVKDGKILKDVNETYKIDNKIYKNKDNGLVHYKKLLKEAEETIKKQNLEIENYQERIKDLEEVCWKQEQKLSKIGRIL